MAEVIDWALAEAWARRMLPGGPPTDSAGAAAAVEDLRKAAQRAVDPVREATGLVAPDATSAVVVDRGTWVRANLDGFRVILEPLLTKMAASSGGPVTAVGSRVTAVELGGVLAWLSGKVLGQYEAFVPAGATPRLLLVAPNIVAAERALGVDPADFRLWVALHEETHRVQFGAVPWLGDHLLSEIHAYLAATDGKVPDRLQSVVSGIASLVRGTPGATLLDTVQTPAQREILDRVTAIMSLLEGHADHIMDAVGPEVVATVDVIRAKFEVRRSSPGTLDGLVRRLLGLDAKLAQYRDGAAFVRGIERLVGREGFNAVWLRPENLPTRGELADPAAWVARVL